MGATIVRWWWQQRATRQTGCCSLLSSVSKQWTHRAELITSYHRILLFFNCGLFTWYSESVWGDSSISRIISTNKCQLTFVLCVFCCSLKQTQMSDSQDILVDFCLQNQLKEIKTISQSTTLWYSVVTSFLSQSISILINLFATSGLFRRWQGKFS